MLVKPARYADIKRRMAAVSLLTLIKEEKTYRELSEILDLPINVIHRYVKRQVLPTTKRARQIIRKLSPYLRIEEYVKNLVSIDENGYIDNSRLVSNINLLRLATYKIIEKYEGMRITKIVASAVDGVPFGTLLANEMERGLVIAKTEKEAGVHDFYEESYILGNSAVVKTLYVPRGSIRKGDSIVIVDDIMREGLAQLALVRLVKKAKASVRGIAVLLTIGSKWRRTLGKEEVEVYSIAHLE